MANRPKEGYPDSWGSKKVSVFPVVGPGSYAQYTAPTTGGQDVNVQGPSGLKMVDWAVGAVTTDGVHRAEVVQIEAATVNGVSLQGARIILKWYVVATGAEVAAMVDLSSKTVYILALGQK